MSLLLYSSELRCRGEISFFVNAFNCSVGGNVMIGFRGPLQQNLLQIGSEGSGIYAPAAFRPTLYASLITHVRRK